MRSGSWVNSNAATSWPFPASRFSSQLEARSGLGTGGGSRRPRPETPRSWWLGVRPGKWSRRRRRPWRGGFRTASNASHVPPLDLLSRANEKTPGRWVRRGTFPGAAIRLAEWVVRYTVRFRRTSRPLLAKIRWGRAAGRVSGGREYGSGVDSGDSARSGAAEFLRRGQRNFDVTVRFGSAATLWSVARALGGRGSLQEIAL